MRHVPSLDGVRGIAVLLVVGFHLDLVGFGWAGVQLFFVLSGYLISAILLQDRDRYDLAGYAKRFYWRRALRIFPLYYGYLFLVTAAHGAWGIAPDAARVWPQLYTYTMDFARMYPNDPGGQFAVHFWSLAVEEQFYLVWPWIVYGLSRRALNRVVIVIMCAGPLIRLATAVMVPDLGGSYIGRVVYVSPFSQVDAFAAGAAVALMPFAAIRNARQWLAGGAALALAFGALNFLNIDRNEIAIRTLGYPVHSVHNWQHVWGFTVINLVSALAVLTCVRGTPVSGLLCHPMLRRIGVVSYGIYVLHYPLFVWARPILERSDGAIKLALSGVCFLVVWGMAELSYRLFESRFLALKDRAFGRGARSLQPAVVPVVSTGQQA